MKALIFIRDIFKKYPVFLTVNTVLVVFVSVLEACTLFTVAPLIDFLTHSDLQSVSPLTKRVMSIFNYIGLPATLGSYLIIFVVFIVLSSGFRIFARHSILRTKYAVMRDLMLGTFEDFFNARWHFFSSEKQGTLLNTFTRELNVVGSAFETIALFFAGFLQLVFYLAVPFYISWQVTAISLATALFFVWPFVLLGKVGYRLGRINTSTANRIASIIQESFGLAKVILGFGNQRKSSDNLKAAFDTHRRATLKSQTLKIATPILYQPFGAVVLIVSLFTVRKFGVPISEMAVLLLGLLRAVFSIGNLASLKNSLENFFPSYEQIRDFRHRAQQLKQQSGDKIFAKFDKEISIEDASFAYPGDEPALVNVNMIIPKGKMVAVVGESGAGKSTLIDVIMGFNEPKSGQITFDGVNLQEFDIYSYRKRIGYVPQESILFHTSIRDNLLWAMEDATDEEIKQACRQANADEFIERLLHGYDTLVGDRGIRLSGGERQRISLARAILRKPALLILDEATSSLDTHSERLIQQAIENITKETTIIVIAHRLSTIVNADYVYVFKNGEVIEEGTYSDLIKMNGHFNRMVKLQLLETA